MAYLKELRSQWPWDKTTAYSILAQIIAAKNANTPIRASTMTCLFCGLAAAACPS
jgi:hypothetical protein